MKSDYELQYEEIQPNYVFLTIPAEWVCVYHKLLVYMSDFGIDIIKDCSAICNSKNKNIVTCWNLFQSALAARELGKGKEAEFFIKYIKEQLELQYSGRNECVFNNTVPLTITEDGKLKAQVSCSQSTRFFVDEITGNLYKKYISEEKDSREYKIEDNHLKVNTD